MRLRKVGWIGVCLWMLSAGLPAQDLASPPSLGVGARVRIAAPSVFPGRIQGTVSSVDNASLTISIEGASSLRVARDAISGLDVSAGRKRHTVRGLVLGAAIGAALLGPFADVCKPGESAGVCSPSRAVAVAREAVVGAALGAGIGYLIKNDRWTALPLEQVRVSLAPTGGRGARLSLSVGF